MKQNFLFFISMACLLCLGNIPVTATAQTDDFDITKLELKIDGVPAVLYATKIYTYTNDGTTYTTYEDEYDHDLPYTYKYYLAPILRPDTYDTEFTVTWTYHGGAGTEVNCAYGGNHVENGGKIHVGNWHARNNLQINGKTYYLYLTTLPVVHLTRNTTPENEKNKFKPGTIQIVSPQGVVNGSNDFRSGCMVENGLIDPTDNSLFFDYYYENGELKYYEKKRNYTIKLLNDDNTDRRENLMDIRATNRWYLDGMCYDPSRLRNRVCMDIWNAISHLRDNAMQRNGTMGKYVELVVDHNYRGIYCLGDTIDSELLGLEKGDPDITADGGPYPEQATHHGALYKSSIGTQTFQLYIPGDYTLIWYEPDLFGTDEYYDLIDKEKTNCWMAWYIDNPDNTYDCAPWIPEGWEWPKYGFKWKPLVNAYQDDDKTTHFYEENMADFFLFHSAFVWACKSVSKAYWDKRSNEVSYSNYSGHHLSVRDMQVSEKLWFTPWQFLNCLGRNRFGVEVAPFGSTDENSMYKDLNSFCQIMQNTEAPHLQLWNNSVAFRNKVYERWSELSQTELHPDSLYRRLFNYAVPLDESGAWNRERRKWNGRIGTRFQQYYFPYVVDNSWGIYVVGEDNEIAIPERVYDDISLIMKWYRTRYADMCNFYEQFGPNGIECPTTQSSAPKGIYTLDGRKISDTTETDHLPAGIYIVDGKKIIR